MPHFQTYLPQGQGIVSAGCFFSKELLQTGHFFCHINICLPVSTENKASALGQFRQSRFAHFRIALA